MRERRKHERLVLLAEVVIPHDDDAEFLFARDLSEGGVFLSAGPDESPWLLPGVPVDLTIALPEEVGADEPGLRLRGRVVWRQDASSGNQPGIGVAFENVEDESRAVLQRILGRLRASSEG